jgi:hypothetical protein
MGTLLHVFPWHGEDLEWAWACNFALVPDFDFITNLVKGIKYHNLCKLNISLIEAWKLWIFTPTTSTSAVNPHSICENANKLVEILEGPYMLLEKSISCLSKLILHF